MASTKNQDFRGMSDDELLEELAATEAEFAKLKFDNAVKGLDNPQIIRETRKDIARMKTELRSRELKIASEAEIAGRSKIRLRRRIK